MAETMIQAYLVSVIFTTMFFLIQLNAIMKNHIIFDDINISPLLKAQKKFDLFRQHLNSEQEKAGAIQAFEFCFELSWRTLKRVLNKKWSTWLPGSDVPQNFNR